ncbi:unnamed protein product, partial [Allacma fusca]
TCQQMSSIFTAVSPKFIYPFSIYRIGIFLEPGLQPQTNYTFTAWIKFKDPKRRYRNQIKFKEGESGQLEIQVKDLENQFYTLMLKVEDANKETFFFQGEIATGQNIRVLIHTDKFVYNLEETVHITIHFFDLPLGFKTASAVLIVRDSQNKVVIIEDLENISEGQSLNKTERLSNNFIPGIWKIIVKSKITTENEDLLYEFNANFTTQKQQPVDFSVALEVPKNIVTSHSTKLPLRITALYLGNGTEVVGKCIVEISISNDRCANQNDAGYNSGSPMDLPQVEFGIHTVTKLELIDFGEYLTKSHANGAVLTVKVNVTDSTSGKYVTEVATVQISRYIYRIAPFGLNNYKRPNLSFHADFKIVDHENRPFQSPSIRNEIRTDPDFQGNFCFKDDGIEVSLETSSVSDNLITVKFRNLTYIYEVPNVDTKENNALQIRLVQPISVNNEVIPGSIVKLHVMTTTAVKTVHTAIFCNSKVIFERTNNLDRLRDNFVISIVYPSKIGREAQIVVFTYIDNEFVSDYLTVYRTASEPSSSAPLLDSNNLAYQFDTMIGNGQSMSYPPVTPTEHPLLQPNSTTSITGILIRDTSVSKIDSSILPPDTPTLPNYNVKSQTDAPTSTTPIVLSQLNPCIPPTEIPISRADSAVKTSTLPKKPDKSPKVAQLHASSHIIELNQSVDIAFKAPAKAVTVYILIVEESCLQDREDFFTDDWLENKLESSERSWPDNEIPGFNQLKLLGMTVQTNSRLQNASDGEDGNKHALEPSCRPGKEPENTRTSGETWLSKMFQTSSSNETTIAPQKITTWILTGYYILENYEIGFFPKVKLQTVFKLFFISSNLRDAVEVKKPENLTLHVFIHNNLPGTNDRNVTVSLDFTNTDYDTEAKTKIILCAPNSITRIRFKIGRLDKNETIRLIVKASTGKINSNFIKKVKVTRKWIQTEELVAGAVEAKDEEFPYQVLLRFNKPLPEEQFCAGIILTPYIILTAAHCFRLDHNGTIVDTPIDTVRVVAGAQSTKIYSNHAETSETFEIESLILHEEYVNKPHMVHDIALLRLKKRITFTNFIKSVLIPNETLGEELSDQAVVSGWGYVPELKINSTNELRKANLTILSNQRCITLLTEFIFKKEMLCASGNGADACKGDSGGPLTCVHKNNTDKQFACGIVSLGLGNKTDNRELCGNNTWEKPGTYTKVSSYYLWIIKNLCDMAKQDECPSNYHKCCNKLCVMNEARCDGFNDCGDNSDEENCNVANNKRGPINCDDTESCPKLRVVFTAVTPKFIYPFATYRIGIFLESNKYKGRNYTFEADIKSEKHLPKKKIHPLTLVPSTSGELEMYVQALVSEFYSLQLKVTNPKGDIFYYESGIASGQNIRVLIHTDKLIYSPQESVHFRVFLQLPYNYEAIYGTIELCDPQNIAKMTEYFSDVESPSLDFTYKIPDNFTEGIWKIFVNSRTEIEENQFYYYNFSTNFVIQMQQPPEFFLIVDVPKYLVTSERTNLPLSITALYMRDGGGVEGQCILELSIFNITCENNISGQSHEVTISREFHIETIVKPEPIEFGSILKEEHANGAILMVNVTVTDSILGRVVSKIVTVQISRYDYKIANFGLTNYKRPNLPFLLDLKLVDLENRPILFANRSDETCWLPRNVQGTLRFKNDGVQFTLDSDSQNESLVLETTVNNLTYKYQVPELQVDERASLQIRLIFPLTVNNEVAAGAHVTVNVMTTNRVETVHVAIFCNEKIVMVRTHKLKMRRNDFEIEFKYPEKIGRHTKLIVFSYVDDYFVSDFLSLTTVVPESNAYLHTSLSSRNELILPQGSPPPLQDTLVTPVGKSKSKRETSSLNSVFETQTPTTQTYNDTFDNKPPDTRTLQTDKIESKLHKKASETNTSDIEINNSSIEISTRSQSETLLQNDTTISQTDSSVIETGTSETTTKPQDYPTNPVTGLVEAHSHAKLFASHDSVELNKSVTITFNVPSGNTNAKTVYLLIVEESCLHDREDFFTDDWFEKASESSNRSCAGNKFPGFAQLKQLGMTVETNAPPQDA